jgi:glycosyltransferase involved in cell wall biosynthesis
MASLARLVRPPVTVDDRMDQPRSVALIVRTLNEEAHVGRLLTGVERQTLPPAQIVIVDSGSTDATLAIAERFGVDIATIDPASFSFGRSLNVGCALATADVLVIASAHVYPVYDTWLEELTAPLSDPLVSLAYGRQVGDDQTHYSERQILRRWFPEQSDHNQRHPFCNNANAAVRRSAWEAFPYDEDLTGLEDMAWAHAALNRGQRIAYVAEAPVAHVHREQWAQLTNRYRREAIAHRRILNDQRMGRIEALRLGLANIASDYLHAVRERKLVGNLTAIPWFRAAQFLGTYQGFAQRGEVSSVLRRRFYYPNDVRNPHPPVSVTGIRGNAIHYDEFGADEKRQAGS